MFSGRSTFDDLSDVTLYSEIIVAKQVGSDYIINFKSLYFMKQMRIQAWFGTDATISRIFGVYDLCEEL